MRKERCTSRSSQHLLSLTAKTIELTFASRESSRSFAGGDLRVRQIALVYHAQTRLRRICAYGAKYGRIVFGAAIAAACGTTPMQPSPTAANSAFAGTWVPTVLIDSCTGSHLCIALDTTWSVLRLAPDGPGIHGSGYFLGTPFEVNGSVDSSGELVIVTPSTPSFSLDELRLRAGSTGLTGTVRFKAPPITIEGHIASAKRGPLESTQSTAEGFWNGNGLTRVCTFTGWRECRYATRIFQLSLTQSGATASGSLQMSGDERYRLPVAGHFTASTLTLTGGVSRPYLDTTIQMRLIT